MIPPLWIRYFSKSIIQFAYFSATTLPKTIIFCLLNSFCLSKVTLEQNLSLIYYTHLLYSIYGNSNKEKDTQENFLVDPIYLTHIILTHSTIMFVFLSLPSRILELLLKNKEIRTISVWHRDSSHPLPCPPSPFFFSEGVYRRDLCQIVILGGNWYFR